MCPPKAPKAPAPEKEKSLRYLLSRDQFDKIGGSAGGSGYGLPSRGAPGGSGFPRNPGSGVGLAPAGTRPNATALK